METSRGYASFRRKQTDGVAAHPYHSPLEGESPACAKRSAAGRQKPSRSLSLSKGRRWWWGKFNKEWCMFQFGS